MRVDTFLLTGLQDNLLHEHAVVLENDLGWNVGIVLLVFGVPLRSCQAVPAHRFDVVLRDAESGGVPVPEAELRLGVTLRSPRTQRVDVETLRYDVTFVATDLWSRPWTASLLLARTGGPMFEYACHEGNVGMTNTLEITRGEESVSRPD